MPSQDPTSTSSANSNLPTRLFNKEALIISQSIPAKLSPQLRQPGIQPKSTQCPKFNQTIAPGHIGKHFSKAQSKTGSSSVGITRSILERNQRTKSGEESERSYSPAARGESGSAGEDESLQDLETLHLSRQGKILRRAAKNEHGGGGARGDDGGCAERIRGGG